MERFWLEVKVEIIIVKEGQYHSLYVQYAHWIKYGWINSEAAITYTQENSLWVFSVGFEMIIE